MAKTKPKANPKQQAMTCAAKKLPTGLDIVSAKEAAMMNPVNRPTAEVVAMCTTMFVGVPEPEAFIAGRLAGSTSRYWGSDGARLKVKFLGQPQAALKTKVMKYLNRWEEFGNLSFVEVQSGADVRLAFQRGAGHYSYIGQDCRHVPANQQTMNLDLNLNSPESEFIRVVPHEGGHAAGLIHEHSRRDVIVLLDPEKTIAVFARRYGWDRQTTIQQVLTPADESDLIGTSEGDQLSVMCYSFDGACTRSGKPVLGGADLSARDKVAIANIYPRPSTPPPPVEGGVQIPPSGTYKITSVGGQTVLTFNP